MVACVWYEQGAAAIAAANGGGNEKIRLNIKQQKNMRMPGTTVYYSLALFIVFSKPLLPKLVKWSLPPFNPIKSYCMDPVKY